MEALPNDGEQRVDIGERTLRRTLLKLMCISGEQRCSGKYMHINLCMRITRLLCYKTPVICVDAFTPEIQATLDVPICTRSFSFKKGV